MSPSDRVALVLCTRHRADDVGGCLETIARQTLLPSTVLVVDSSDDDATRQVVETARARWPEGDLVYQHSAPSLTYQRTVGIAATASDVIVFVDDDVRLDDGCIDAIMEQFRVGGEAVLGVGAFMVDQAPRNVKRLDEWFGLDSAAQGVVLPSGRNIPVVREPARAVDVDWLSGAVMAYRRSALAVEPPDPDHFPFEGEDVDLSFRVGRHGRLVVTPHARYRHLESATNRVVGAAQAEAELAARLLRVRLHPDRLSTRAAYTAAGWQLVKYAGSAVLTASSRRWAIARGTARALRVR